MATLALSTANGNASHTFNSQIENRRDLLWYGREQIADLPEDIARYTGHNFLSRAYRIVAGGQTLMLINEKFTLEKDHAIRIAA